MSRYFLLQGLPGSGKGTQAEALRRHLGIGNISCGDLFRRHVRDGTTFGVKAREYIAKGELTPDAETCNMVIEHLSGLQIQFIILEGFPRTLQQAARFGEFIYATQAIISRVILLSVDRSELALRLSSRYICTSCGKIYNTISAPPTRPGVCNVEGASLYQRTDDKAELVLHRLDYYSNAEAPVMSYYQERGLLSTVDANGPEDIVTQRLIKEMEIWI